MDFFPLIDSPELIYTVIIVMNDILHSNPRTTLTQKIPSIYYKPLNFLTTLELLTDSLHENLLHKFKDVHLERSESFHDLRLSHQRASLPLRHVHSCPDLSGIHLMHPQLHGILMTRTTGIREDVEVPGGLQKCKNFILDYWNVTV